MVNTLNPVKLTIKGLDLAKQKSFDLTDLKLRQGDKGYILQFDLTANWKDYLPTVDTLGFRALKPDGQVIDVYGERFEQNGSVFELSLPDELTEIPATAMTAHIYCKNDEVLYSSSTFTFVVEAKFGLNSASNSYVTEINTIMVNGKAIITGMQNLTNQLQAMISDASTKILQVTTDLTAQVKDWTSKTLADLTKALADKQAALGQLNADYTAKLQAIATEWTTAKTGYDSQATVAMTKVADDAKAQRDALEAQFTGTFLAGLRAEFDTLKAQWTTRLADLQQALNTAKTDQTALRTAIDQAQKDIQAVNDKIAAIDPDAINAGIKAAKDAAAAAQATANDAKTGVGTINTKLGVVPDGSTIMAEIAKGGKVQTVNNNAPDAQGNVSIAIPSVAGMVKSATINGGSVVQADASGNLALTVPDPDLSGFVTKTDLDGRKYYTADQVQAAINTALTAFKTTLIWSGTQAEYDKLTADQKAQYIALGVVK